MPRNRNHRLQLWWTNLGVRIRSSWRWLRSRKKWQQVLGAAIGAIVVGVLTTTFADIVGVLNPLSQFNQEHTEASEQPKGGTGKPRPKPEPAQPKGDPLKLIDVEVTRLDSSPSFVAEQVVPESALEPVNQMVEPGSNYEMTDYTRAMLDVGAAPTFSTRIELELVGNRSEVVRITEMRALPDCRPLPNGTFFFDPPGGRDATIGLGFDLTKTDPYAEKMTPQDGLTGESYFDDAKYNVGPGRHATIQAFVVLVAEKYCEFEFELELVVGKDKVVTQILTDKGDQPFRLSGINGVDESNFDALYVKGLAASACPGYESGWMRQDPRTFAKVCHTP